MTTPNAQRTLKRYLTTVAAVLAGIVVGAGITSAALVPMLNDAIATADRTAAELERTETDLTNAQGFNTELLEAAEDVETAAAEIEEREAAVKKREDAVTSKEEQIAANSFGDGMHVVGINVASGIYRNEGVESCYYAWMSSTGSDADIVDNDLTDGPATVTLREGENFRSDGCGTWTKVG